MKRSQNLLIAAVLAAALTAPGSALAADPGAVDAEFGNAGTALAPNLRGPARIALDSAGRLLVVGRVRDGLGIVRFRESGNVDKSFGAGGVGIPIGDGLKCSSSCHLAIAMVASDKMLVLTSDYLASNVRRLDREGGTDRTYGESGVVKLPIAAGVVVAAADGSALIAGSSKGGIVLCRLDPQGRLTAEFGGDGCVETGVPGFPGAGTPGNLGSTILAGDVHGQAFAWRFSLDGALVESFGTAGSSALSGKPYSQGGEHWYATSLATFGDGSIAFGGSETFIGCTIRGAWDCTRSYQGSFGQEGGIGKTDINTTPWFDSRSTVFGNGRGEVYSTGATSDYTGEIVVARYGADGKRDLGFGIDGESIPVRTGGGGYPQDALVRPDGRQVVATPASGGIALTQFLGDSGGIAAPKRRIIGLDRTALRKKHKLVVTGLTSPASARTEFAIRKVESPSIRRRLGCSWYRKQTRTFKHSRSKGNSCTPTRFYKISGGARWQLALSRRLKAGDYEFWVRAVTADGALRTPVVRGSIGFLKFDVWRKYTR